jgi:hypothetical protein
MLCFPVQLSKGILDKAKAMSSLRISCKKFLSDRDLEFDKFTMVTHDSYTAYITELFMKIFFEEKFSEKGIKISAWDEQFDLKEINRILSSGSHAIKDIEYIKNYFYDNYDLSLEYNQKELFIDIKTALTQKQPKLKWNFLYPVVQAHKKGKDIMVLTYYIVEDISHVETLKEICIAGYIMEEEIKKCPKILQGQKTRYKTISQIDNYITELSRDYSSNFEKILDLF